MDKGRTGFMADPALRFTVQFLALFAILYISYLAILSYTTPGGAYSPFLEAYFNPVHWLRWLLLHTTQLALQMLGYTVVVNEINLLVAGHNMIILNYDCLGFGVMCFFSAFVLTFPKPWKQRLIFLLIGLIAIQALNVVRLGWLSLHWLKPKGFFTDQHTIFNITIYVLIFIALYFWIKSGSKTSQHATNRSV